MTITYFDKTKESPFDEYAVGEGHPARTEPVPLSKSKAAMVAILADAEKVVCGSRNEAYGEPDENHRCTARMWSAYLSRQLGTAVELSSRDVCFLNILQKCSREAHWSQRDNSLDVIGYAANAEAC